MENDMANTPRTLIVNDLLCYFINKFGRLPNKQLKSVILDFYATEEISNAKELLIIEVDKTVKDKWPKPARRRKDSSNRTANEVDDIYQVITCIDNHKLLNQLPLFVSCDPDKMPSIKLTEGDMAMMLAKLDTLEQTQLATRRGVEEILEKHNIPKIPYIQAPMLPKVDLQLPCRSIDISDVAASEGAETSDNEGFISQRQRKRKKISPLSTLSSHPVSYSSVTASNLREQSNDPKTKPKSKMSRHTVIGASTTSTLKASKSLIVNKAVYCLGNIDSSYSVTDIENYIRSMGIRILTCFELKRSERQPEDNKSFRLCIAASDKDKLIDSSIWSLGVTLREWIHKPRPSDSSSVIPSHNKSSAVQMETVILHDVAEGNAEAVGGSAINNQSNG